jgi:hypothetical protein
MKLSVGNCQGKTSKNDNNYACIRTQKNEFWFWVRFET